MKQDIVFEAGDVMMSANWWSTMRAGIEAAMEHCNDITAAVEAHKRTGKYNAEELLKMISGYARDARNTLEAVLPPF